MTKDDKKIIIVTGGAGFVGSHLCEALVQDSNNQVISLDNYFTGSKENHIHGVEYREGHTKDIEEHIQETPSIIYHLGEYSRVRQSLEEPRMVLDLNMEGTFGVVEFWRKHASKLVYAGSSTKFTKARDDGVEGRNLAPYTWAKAVNSELVQNYANWYDLNFITVYFYNVYGPRELTNKYGTVVGILKQQYLEGKPLTIASPGTQKRAFTHVDDTISGILTAVEKGDSGEYGVGAEDVYSLIELAKLFGDNIEMLPQTQSTRSSSTVNSSKLLALGWKPGETLKEYVEAIKKKKVS